jgi:ERCC4-type nuclease|tara:strand:+ start:13256 stop:13960 length:705 start_codon:yes stop_codon:yes gene_type:complete
MRRPAMIVDSNERGVLCDSVLRKAEKAGLSVIRKPLVVGDYLLGEACVEAKSINDLFLSSHSGHLWRQLENMDINYPRFFLVIHGGIDKYVAIAKKTGKKVTYTRIQNELTGTIARIMSDFDCQVFYTPNVSEAALFITKLHNKLHKPASSHGARTIRRVASNDIRADMLLAIPGIGKDMADRILEQCGSIEEMCFPESLKKIKGLGDVLRGRIVQALTSEEKMVVERKVKRRV